MAECEKSFTGGTRIHRVTVVAAEAEDLPICWICLDGPSIDKPLMHPCRCPSYVHSTCIARWQLQSAGTRREKFCDFCNCELPDWKSVLTPTLGGSAPAVMNVNFDNKTYSFHVAPGADGYRQFTEAIRRAFHLPDDSELNITFTCDEPSSGSLLTLSGPGAYDAAVHCASVSAARRTSTSSSTGSERPVLPPLPLGQQQQQQEAEAAADAGSEDSQQPPITPRLSDRGQGAQQQVLPSRHSSASSSSNSLGASPAAAAAAAGDTGAASTHQQQQQQLSSARSIGGSSNSSSGNSDGFPAAHSPSSSSSSGGSSSSAGRQLSRGLSRGRALSAELGSSIRSLSRMRSAGSNSVHSRNSSSNSLAEPEVASMPGCFPTGASSSNSLVAEAERGMSSGSSSASGTSSGSKRGSGLGRKLRDALAELLISK